MDKKLLLKTLILWFVLLLLAILNGALRTFGYKPVVGDLVAHQISTVIFIALIFVTTWIGFRKDASSRSDKSLILVGIVWLVLTELFEFVAGHYLFGNSWERILADYNILNGRIWVFVLIAILFMPLTLKKTIKAQKHS